ncbi:hypothetical protein [Anaerolinea sp.]|uniref:hypothetical protein n=1 Tax=Anaerolinea sp. TaxID=1872519 RepID=UPI002ACE41CB|nr:hypothetical protein [Anaerolinea sp.]
MSSPETPLTLHQQALEWADKAYIARKKGRWEASVEYARQALQYEIEAAEKLPPVSNSEPTRSILYRGAASLAYQAKDYKLALQLIEKGRTPHAPEEILFDLDNLAQDVRFALYLQEIGFTLSNEEALISLRGQATGYGTILYKEFIRRLNALMNLLQRTAERLNHREYRRSGRPERQVFEPMIATAPPGSFAFKLRLALADITQLSLWVNTENILSEIVTNIEIATANNPEVLKERFLAQTSSEEQANLYLRNFLAITKQIAPDGKHIEEFSITTVRQQVLLTSAQGKNIQDTLQSILQDDESGQGEPITVIGELDRADKRKNKIEITEERTYKTYTVVVKEGLEDVVRSYFGERVTVQGMIKNDSIYLQDIGPAEK